METKKFDSLHDTVQHMKNVRMVMSVVSYMIAKRTFAHDESKLSEPEKSCYDKYIPMLREVKYGTPEYDNIKKQMYDEGLSYHYAANNHHPEHYDNGVFDMTIVDLIEMICDWFAASLRSDTPFNEGCKNNFEKYLKDPNGTLLQHIIKNTYHSIFQPIEEVYKNKTDGCQEHIKQASDCYYKDIIGSAQLDAIIDFLRCASDEDYITDEIAHFDIN